MMTEEELLAVVATFTPAQEDAVQQLVCTAYNDGALAGMAVRVTPLAPLHVQDEYQGNLRGNDLARAIDKAKGLYDA